MALNSDIRDQAYQFFIEEAPELLHIIEAGLLRLRQERSTAKVHDLMRAAHSLKGGAASVELDAIKTLAHRLETIFKALYNETIEIDTDLESQLLQAYDCLRLPLMEQIDTGDFDMEYALIQAEPIFAQIEERLGEALNQGETYIPSSAELGVNMAKSIFEVDVAQGLEHLTNVLAHPYDYEVAGEIRAQAEVFAGFAELLNQPEFGAIAKTTLTALEAHPNRALVIGQLALSDFELGRQILLTTMTQGATSSKTLHLQQVRPSPALLELANSTVTNALDFSVASITESIAEEDSQKSKHGDAEQFIPEIPVSPCLRFPASSSVNPPVEEFPTVTEVSENTQPAAFDGGLDDIFSISLESLEDFTALEVTEDIQPVAQGEALLDAIVDSNVFPSKADAGKIEEAEISLPTLELNNSTLIPCDPLLSEFSIDLEAVADATSLTEATVEEKSFVEDISTAFVVNSKTTADTELQIGEESSHALEELGRVCKPGDPPQPSLLRGENSVKVPLVNSDLGGAKSDRVVCRHTLETTASQSLITEEPETLEEAVQSLGEIFDELPPLESLPAPTSELTLTTSTAANLTLVSEAASLVPASSNSEQILPIDQAVQPVPQTPKERKISTDSRKGEASPASLLSVRVGSERLERMNNLVGELAINRNGLSLQNDQLQSSVRELLNRFSRVQIVVGNLQELSYQMLVTPERHNSDTLPRLVGQLGELMARQADFDSLELDNYGVLNSRLQELLEDMVQLEEAVDDIVLFAKQSDQTLEQQRQMLTQLRDELIWARMLPLGEVLNRFPRVLRDLSTRFRKSVNLKLSGTSVLVDKAVLEKLYDPLLHLLRNAFDHGIESPQDRIQQGKPEQGQIEIRAYHQGSQTIIEVKDDGQGLDLDSIRAKALELGLLTEQVLPMTSTSQLYELIFEAGFSTSKQVSELSGRGVGLDVVRAQMRSLKGTISVTSSPGVGTTFTLRLPLTLTIAKLLVCFVGSTALALPSDGVEEIVIPKASQIKDSGRERFLQWRGQIVPAYRLSELLEYNCPLPDMSPSKALVSAPTPQDWALPMLVLCQDKNVLALEIDRLVTEQELVIKPFGSAIAPPSFTYGCTILGDGSLIPVIDGAVLLDQLLGHHAATSALPAMKSLPASVSEAELLDTDLAAPSTEVQGSKSETSLASKIPIKTMKAPTVLVVDDAVALRRTLALTLERAGCQVLQARDGREAIEQLQHSASVKLVICDVEMPNMNGFEFLSHRRQDSQLSKIPVAMLTSRSNDKHRWLAMQLGATAYFTKPYLEQEFVTAIKELINQSTPEPQLALLPTV